MVINWNVGKQLDADNQKVSTRYLFLTNIDFVNVGRWLSNAIRNCPLCVMKNCPHHWVHDLS
jgi:hypothetical protein